MFSFKDVGKEIKGFTSFIGWILWLPCVLFSILLLIIAFVLFSAGIVEFGIFPLVFISLSIVIVVNYILARLLIMFTYGYGELVENSKIIAENICINNQKSIVPSSATSSPQKTTIPNKEKEPFGKTTNQGKTPIVNKEKEPFWKTANQGKTSTEPSVTVTPVVVDSIRVQCPKCQRIQLKSRESCSECGTMFKF